MKLLDSRRLFGPNLQTRGPGAIAEIEFEPGEDPAAAVAAWERRVREVVPEARTAVRHYRGGAALVIGGEPDEILLLTEVNERAVTGAGDAAALAAALEAAPDWELRLLVAEATRRGLPALVDDMQLSIGLGKKSRVYERTALPRMAAVPWDALGRVPVGMVTGTNGKTTTSRLAGRMAELAELRAGVAMTDGITVGGVLVERGDYTGPDAARIVLRHPEVDIAILETARGGILRRGLALPSPDAAVITNVSDDHLGLYGIDDVATMTEVKAVVARAARVAVLNRADEGLRLLGATLPHVVWTGPGGDWTVVDGWVVRNDYRMIRVIDMPLSFEGAAGYNVENALSAAALAAALGVPDDGIIEALRTFTSGSDDNPGRGNWHDAGGVQVLLDFAHNPEGVRAVMGLVAARRRAGLHIVFAQPGDRRDDAILAVARAIAAARPDRVVLHDLAGYLRGREPGTVPAMIRRELTASGVTRIDDAAAEAPALAAAIAGAAPGDVVVLMPLLDPEGVGAVLARR